MFNFLFSLAMATDPIGGTQIPTTPTTIPTMPVTSSFNIVQFLSQLLPFILIAVIFYLFIIRPQNQQRKQLGQMIHNLKIGDKIVTKGGIIGKINKIQENSFIVELMEGTKVEILKHAIISMINGENK